MSELFLLGVFGQGHCLAMCSGLALALRGKPVAYQSGRLTGYVSVGALAGLLGFLAGGLRVWLLGLAGLVMVVMGLGLLGWAPKLPAGPGLWLARLMRSRLAAGSAFGLGAASAMLPCGLLYAALARSAASPGMLEGALGMGAFWLGTLPVLVAVRWLSLRPGTGWARLGGWVTVAVGLSTLYRAWTFQAGCGCCH